MVYPDGPVVVLTVDPREGEFFWLYEYFPEIAGQVRAVFPPVEDVIRDFRENSAWATVVKPFPLPRDLADRNMCSGWYHPELYFDKLFRDNTLGFALAAPDAVTKGLARLEKDLSNGRWDSNYGLLRGKPAFDAGFRLLVFK